MRGYSSGVYPKLHHPNHHDGNGIFLPCSRFASQPVVEARRYLDSENYHENLPQKIKKLKNSEITFCFFSIQTETETISKHGGHKGGQKHPTLLQKSSKEWVSNAASLFWFRFFWWVLWVCLFVFVAFFWFCYRPVLSPIKSFESLQTPVSAQVVHRALLGE